jgi:hypothetical protein
MNTDNKAERASDLVARFEAGTLSEAEARQGLIDLGEDPDLVEEILAIASGADDVVEQN